MGGFREGSRRAKQVTSSAQWDLVEVNLVPCWQEQFIAGVRLLGQLPLGQYGDTDQYRVSLRIKAPGTRSPHGEGSLPGECLRPALDSMSKNVRVVCYHGIT